MKQTHKPNQISYEERMKIRDVKLSELTNFKICDSYIDQMVKFLWSITGVLFDNTSIEESIGKITKSFHDIEDCSCIVKEYLIQEFSNNPVNAKYFFDYTISKLDATLQRTFDYKNENFIIVCLDNKLEDDILYGQHNGEEIKSSNLNEAQISEFKDLTFKLSHWALAFHLIVRFLEKLYLYYPFQFTLSFKSNSFEHGEGIFEERDNSETPKFVDKRVNKDAPTNPARIKALKEYCPELWNKLTKSQSKQIQQKVIRAITGANKEDSYKWSFGSRNKQMEKTTITDFVNLSEFE